MFRRLFAICIPVVLAGCFQSETAVIAPADLARPADFAGRYWAIEQDGDIRANNLFRAAGQGFVYVDPDDGKQTALRLVQLVAPDVFLMIDDSEGGTSTYYLARRRARHVWQFLDMDAVEDAPFRAANLAQINAVAGRHGFALAAGGEATPITGPVKSGRIAQLFRDPDFLGAVGLEVLDTYLPQAGVSGPGALDDQSAPDVTARGLYLSDWQPERAALADPAGLAGVYMESAGSDADPRALEVRKLPDGRFAIDEFARQDMRWSMLAFGDEDGQYLAVAERGTGDEATRTLNLVLRTDSGWQFQEVMIAVQQLAPELDRLRERAMAAAAQRHGLRYAETKLSGAITAPVLLALLRDGQFTSGLRTTVGLPRRFVSEAAIANTLTARKAAD